MIEENEIKNKITSERDYIKKEVRKKLLTYSTAAFGLVAGLAWNDAIGGLIEYFFPLEKNNLWVKFGYAILITLVIVVITIYLTRLLKEEAGEEIKK